MAVGMRFRDVRIGRENLISSFSISVIYEYYYYFY